MAVLKLTKDDIIKNDSKEGKITLKKSDLSYDSTKVFEWENDNKQALDILNNYNDRINKSEWLDEVDRKKYRSALDSYIETSNRLRSINKTLGEGFADEDELKWNESIASMNRGYDEISRYYSQFTSATDYTSWYANQKKSEEFRSVLDDEDFDEYVKLGTGVSNPTYKDSNAPVNLLGWKPFGDGEPVNNVVTFAESVTYAPGGAASDYALDSMDGKSSHPYYEDIPLVGFMELDEKNIYHYYIGKGDKAKADEYLSSLKDTLRRRQAKRLVQEIDGTVWEAFHSAAAGLEQFASGIKNIDNLIMGTEGESTTSTQYAQAELSSNNTGIWKVTNDLINTTGNMLPSIAVGMVTGGAGGALTMGASSMGNAYSEMRNAGYNEWQARGYGVLVGASEAALSYVLGGISPLGNAKGGVISKATTKALGQVDNGLARFAIKWGSSMFDEAIEESAQSVLEPIFKSIFTGEAVDIDWGEVAYSGLLGALSAGFLESIPTAVESYGESKNAKITKEYFGGETEALLAEAAAIKDSGKTVDKYIERYGKKGTLSGTEISDLLDITDKGKIKAAAEATLTQYGEKGDISKIADVIAKIRSGEKISKAEQAILVNSEYGRRVSTESNPDIINAGGHNTGWAEGIGTRRINAKEYNGIGLSSSEAVPSNAKTPIASVDSPEEGKKEIPADPNPTIERDGEQVEVKIDKIESIDNGEISVKLESGEILKVGEVEIGGQMDLVYQAASDMATRVGGFNVDTANAFVKGYDPSTGLTAAEYVHGWSDAYRFGKHGYPFTELERGAYTSKLTDEQRARAYSFGKVFGNDQVGENQAKVVNTVTKNAENISKKASEMKKGKVYFDGETANVKLNARQKASVKGLEVVAKALGIDIHIFESPLVNGKREGENGSYDPDTKTLRIDLYAGVKGDSLMLFTAAHELTHHIKAVSPTKFKLFADALLEEYAKHGLSVEELIEAKKEFLEEKGRITPEMSEEQAYDLAYEEVVADACEAMLVDSDAMQALSRKIKEKDKGLWQTIKDFIGKLIARIKAAYKDLSPDSVEANLVRRMTDSAERLQKLWVDALLDASEASTDLVEIDTNTESVAPIMHSERTWTESEYVVHRDQMAQKIADALGVTVKKAKSYIDDINSIARMIANDRVRLDYEASSFGSAFVSNVEYGGSFDYTTLCKKRRIYTGTFTEIQKRLKDVALSPDDILTIRNLMIQEGIEATCGLCYVEGSRANMGKFAKEFIRLYKRDNPLAWIPNMADVNTPDGVEQMRISHPEAYEQYVYFWNHYGKLKDSDPALFASQQKPKLYEARKEYKGEILEHFKGDSTVAKKNRNGGIRMQSFSDFEIVHLIDTMQVIMDMSTVGLAGQAYTKVPELARAFGNTGLKINLSLIAKGVDADGNLIFDDREGMPHKTAFELRDRYSKNVGTIIVTFTDEQLLAAMADPRIDFIIPFHRSQWKKGQYGAMGLPKGTKDYTYMQNEKLIKKTYHEYRGRMVLDKATNYMPNEYWDFSKSGKENAEAYLKMCAENNKRPKFYKLLDYDGKGTYSLKADGSTDGYWKLLIDFKMYDNAGIGSPQQAVAPTFNMDEAKAMLDEYQGGHSQYPVASSVVDTFVEKYNNEHRTKYSDRGSIDNYREKSYNLYTATDDFKRDVAPNDQSYFSRSLANKTSGLADGEVKDIWINGAENVYVFRADGYMRGEMITSFSSNNKQMLEDIANEYDKIDQSTEDASLWAETLQSDEGGSSVYSSVHGRGRSGSSDSLYENSSSSDTARGSERERLTHRTEEEYDEIVKKVREMYGLDTKKYSDRDSNGNTLSKEQQKFFKDSKIRDRNGNLLTVYHSTDAEFTVFDKAKIGSGNGGANFGKGFYFTPDLYLSGEYGDNAGEYYLNIKNPFEYYTVDKDYIIDMLEKSGYQYDKKFVDSYDADNLWDADLLDDFLGEALKGENPYAVFSQMVQNAGFDGIWAGDEIVAFESEQIKLTSNKNPTSNPDIRYSDRNTASFNGKAFWSGSVSLLDGVIEEVHTMEEAEAADYHHSMYFSQAQIEKMENEENAFFFVENGKVQGDWRVSVPEDIIKRIEEQIEISPSAVEQREFSNADIKYSIREEAPPKKTKEGYKVFVVKDGKLYPPMVANPNAQDTPVGVWLNADVGTRAPDSKTGRMQVKAGGKGTQGGSGSLAFRPGWHLGETPLATQFDRLNPETGVKELFPENFVWALCDIAADHDYQEEAMSYGYTKNGKFQHSLAGLPKLPKDGYYKYRTNPNPDTVPWLITGAMKVKKLLSDAEVNAILKEKGLAPKQRVGGEKTLADLGLSKYEGKVFQDRATDGLSNRSLLSSALETTAQNDIEREKLKQYKQKIDLINAEEQKLQDLRARIKELSFAKGPRDTKAIKDLQFEANQAANRINTYDRQLLNLESTKALKGVLEREKAKAFKRAEKIGKEALERYREKAANTQRELMDRYQESRKKAAESRNKTAMRYKIKGIVSELNTLLLKPNAKKHIKEELRKEVANALSAINMDTVGADERVAYYNDLIAKQKDPDVIEELTKSRDRIQEQGDNLKEKLDALNSAYEKIKNTDDIELNLAYQEVIQNSIKGVSEKIGKTSIRNMTLEQLEMVYDLFSMIRKTIRDANKAFKAKKGETIIQMAEAVNDQVRTVGGQPYKRNAIKAALQRVSWTFLKPFVAFRTIGSDTLTNMYKELRAGEDTFYGDVKAAQAFIEEQYKKHNYKSWNMKKTKDFTAKSGKSFKLTLEQMMSLYAYSRREQAHDHIIVGGIVFEDALIVEKNKLGIPVKYEVTTKDAFNLSEETLAEIANSLTAEQKAFVDAMQDYLSTVMGEKGNEVSMELLGVKLFKEKFYLPIKSSQYYRNFSAEEAGEIKLKSPAFSKETVTHANNPIVIHNFTDLWAEHVNDMSMYHAFVLALEDFTRVYNYKTKTDANVETMDTKATLETAYPGVTKYISKFLKDMNGGVRSETVGWADKLTSLAKKGAVLGSWSVAIQQPSAVMRAMAMISPKYFVTTAHKSLNLLKHKQDWAELKKYAPIAGIKEMGRFDVGMGQGTVDWIQSNKTLMEIGEDALSAAPAFADEVAWVTIWNAVKRETAHNNPTLATKSEEFLKLAGERFTDVISMTQVYDSVFSRSDLMRNKSWIAKALTAFMAEPTTTLNMIWDAWVQAKRVGGFKAHAKAIGTTGAPIVASIVLNAALKSIIMAMRDDDEDESYGEKYVDHFAGDLKDNLNPLTLVPFAKDVVSIFKGYDVERMDMALFSDLKNAMDAFDSNSKTDYEKWSGLIGAISAFFGVPIKNVERDVRGLINTFFGGN